MFALLQRTPATARPLQEHRARFDQAFEQAAGNVTGPGESNAIVRPLHLLTSATSCIAAGDLDSSVQLGSKDEIGTLADSFNGLAARLRELRRSDLGKDDEDASS